MMSASGGAATPALAAMDLAFAGTDIVVSLNENVIEQEFGADGAAFLQAWNGIYATYGIATALPFVAKPRSVRLACPGLAWPG